MFREAHTARPVAKTTSEKERRKRKTTSHNLPEPLTTALYFSTQRIHSAFSEWHQLLLTLGRSWKNWGHRGDWNRPFPQCLLWRDLRSSWDVVPKKSQSAGRGFAWYRKERTDFKEGFKLEPTDEKNRMRVCGEEQKVEDRSREEGSSSTG